MRHIWADTPPSWRELAIPARTAYADLPAEQYRAILNQAGLPQPVVDLIVDADVAIADGTLDHVTDDLTTLLGRPATPMSTCVAAALQG